MKKFIGVALIGITLSAALCSNSFAMSNDDYLRMTLDSASARTKEAATVYVNGVTMGFMIANIAGKDTSICFPKQMAINEFNFKSLVNAEMETDKTVDGEFPVAVTLFRALKRRFPCK
jgi:hypothetical protein